MRSRNFKNFLVLIALFAGCGESLFSPEYHGEPLMRIQGAFNVPEALNEATSKNRWRMAILWNPLFGGNGRLEPAQFEKIYPNGFILDIAAPPSMKVVNISNEIKFKGAIGTLIVFDDVNDNGLLDLAPTNQSDTEMILGSSLPGSTKVGRNYYAIYYCDGTLPAEFAGIPQGYSLRAYELDAEKGSLVSRSVDPNKAFVTVDLTGASELGDQVRQKLGDENRVDR